MGAPLRRRYHSDVKLAAGLGILPEGDARTIPSSTLHRFRTSDYSDLVGLPFCLEEQVELVRRFAGSARAKAAYAAYLRCKQLVIRVLSFGRSIPATFARHKRLLVETVEQVRGVLGLRRALRILGLTTHRYTRWRNQVLTPCFRSPLSRCFRSHPGQLSQREVSSIRKTMANPFYRGWPAISIYWHEVRNGVFGFARSTFYKYLHLLGISPVRGTCRRKDHAEGIRASAPDEIWHADVTLFRTLDHVLVNIYLVVDNFSRKILAWTVSRHRSALIQFQTVQAAYARFVEQDERSAEPLVLTDAGSENARLSEVPVKHIIAQKDVRFSNSMVESLNKTVKYQSLYLADLPDIDAVRRHLEKFIPIYNDVRPHCAHGYLTPTEVHAGALPVPRRFAQQFTEARRRRIEANRSITCPPCEPSHE